jgi:hypothetical protein
MKIFTFGDSHGSCGGWNTAYITAVYHGPLLCYTVGKKVLEVMNISLYDVQEGDAVIFCFGEIDCRCHIKKHITEEISYQNIIDDIIYNYFEAIRINIDILGKKVKPYVFNVVPPVESETIIQNPDFPTVGSDEERKSYVIYFNKKIKEYCEKYDYGFFDVYDKYTNENGMLKKELSDNNVHIAENKYITEFIIENILNNDK